MRDIDRCEVSFLGRIVYLVVIGGIQCKTDKHHKELARIALLASMEPFEKLDARKSSALRRRVMRMEEVTIAPMTHKTHAEEVILVVYYFINRLIESEYIDVPEETNLWKIMDYLLSLLDLEKDTIKSYIKTAPAKADKWLKSLEGQGYYKINWQAPALKENHV